MPYCIFFNGGDTIHGSLYISNRNTSGHGCILVYPNPTSQVNFTRASRLERIGPQTNTPSL